MYEWKKTPNIFNKEKVQYPKLVFLGRSEFEAESYIYEYRTENLNIIFVRENHKLHGLSTHLLKENYRCDRLKAITQLLTLIYPMNF